MLDKKVEMTIKNLKTSCHLTYPCTILMYASIIFHSRSMIFMCANFGHFVYKDKVICSRQVCICIYGVHFHSYFSGYTWLACTWPSFQFTFCLHWYQGFSEGKWGRWSSFGNKRKAVKLWIDGNYVYLQTLVRNMVIFFLLWSSKVHLFVVFCR